MIETELKRHQQSVSTRSSCCVTWNADDRDDGVIADFDFEDSACYHRVLRASYDITLILPLLIAVSSIALSRGPPKQRERCHHMLPILPFSPPAPSNPPPSSPLQVSCHYAGLCTRTDNCPSCCGGNLHKRLPANISDIGNRPRL